ncbi:hypothetical protein C8J56DRAFT_1170471 [Mycena floridula]|nr:hypothetical protein C8J56DRAFT_1170471 [Mycena floridula]
MNLSELPDDVLLRIIYFLNPVHIIRLRLVCSRFQALTRERTVWISAHRNPDLFIWPEPLSPLSDAELERKVVHAAKLGASWLSCKPSVVRTTSTTRMHRYEMNSTHILLGRYLVIARQSVCSVYDLELEVTWPLLESCQHPFTAHTSPVDDPEPYIFVKTRLTGELRIWSLRKGEVVEITTIVHEALKVPKQVLATLKDFVLFKQIVVHIPTQQSYECILETQEQNGETPLYVWPLLTPTHAIFVSQFLDQSVFEAFPLPDPMNKPPLQKLKQTHFGIISKGISEATYLFSTPRTPQTPSRLTLASITPPTPSGMKMQICFYDTTLNNDGTITFQLTTVPPLDSFSPYGIRATVSTEGRARIITYPGKPSPHLLAYETWRLGDGSLKVVQFVLNDISPGQNTSSAFITFDGFSGRICVTSDDASGLKILEYVQS